MNWTASAMSAAQSQLDTATQNLAAAPTDGFQRTILRASLGSAGISLTKELDHTHGALHRTGRPLDVAVTGPGGIFLTDGTTIRGGSFERSPQYRLTTADGRELRGEFGALKFPENAVLERDGRVAVDGHVVDRLRLSADTQVATGFVEASNTDSAKAMIEVLDAQRRFETAQKAEQSIDAADQKNSSETARPAA